MSNEDTSHFNYKYHGNSCPLLGQTSESFEESELINFYLFDNVEYIEYRLGQPLITTQVYFEDQPNDAYLKDSLIVKPVTDANGTKIAHFDFLVEDYRGFDISKGIAGNPTIGFLSPQSNNNSNNK